MSIKFVVNDKFGGFSLSDLALAVYNTKRTNAGLPTRQHSRLIERTDPHLVEVVEELGAQADGKCAKLKVVTISAEYATCYQLHEYDGSEEIICDPANLIEDKIRRTNVADLTDAEAKAFLLQLSALVPPFREINRI